MSVQSTDLSLASSIDISARVIDVKGREASGQSPRARASHHQLACKRCRRVGGRTLSEIRTLDQFFPFLLERLDSSTEKFPARISSKFAPLILDCFTITSHLNNIATSPLRPSHSAKMAKAASSKKASTIGASGSGTTSALEQVQTLQSALLSSSDLNPLSDLLTLSKKLAKVRSDRSPKEKKDAAVALHRAALVLVSAMKSLSSENRIPFDKDVDQDGYILSYGAKAGNKVDSTTSAKAKEAQNKVEDWIRMRWNETIELLCGLLGHEVEGLRLEARQMLFELQTAASSSLTRITAAAAAARAQAKAAAAAARRTQPRRNRRQPPPCGRFHLGAHSHLL